MSEPKRIQRKRTKGWKMPPNTVYVGRPTKWGNPFKVGSPYIFGVHSADTAVFQYSVYMTPKMGNIYCASALLAPPEHGTANGNARSTRKEQYSLTGMEI